MLRLLHVLSENEIIVNTILHYQNNMCFSVVPEGSAHLHCVHILLLLPEVLLVRRIESIQRICYLLYLIPSLPFHRYKII